MPTVTFLKSKMRKLKTKESKMEQGKACVTEKFIKVGMHKQYTYCPFLTLACDIAKMKMQ